MKCRTLTTVLVGAALIVGCNEQNALTDSQDALTDPTFSFINGPGNPGSSGVFRFQDASGAWNWVLATSDPTRDLLAYHFQSDDWVGCGGSSFRPLSDIQLVTNPQEIHEGLHVLAKAEAIPILIYRLSDPEPDFCIFLEENWLYKGTHNFSYRDSDFTLGGPGADAYGWTAQGIVYDRDGALYRYSENQLALIGPNNDFRGWKNENIRVLPVGGN